MIKYFKSMSFRKRIIAIVLAIAVIISTLSGAIYTIITYSKSSDDSTEAPAETLVTTNKSDTFTNNYNSCIDAFNAKDFLSALKYVEDCIDEAIMNDTSDDSASTLATLYTLRGQIYYYLEDYNNAYTDFNRFITRETTDTDLLLMYVDINSALGNLDTAIIFAKLLIAVNESTPLYHTILGDLYLTNLENDKAIDEYKISLSLTTNDSDKLPLLSSIAQLQINFTDYKDSYDTLSEYIDINQTSGLIFYNHGLSCVQLDKYNEAITSFTKAIELNYETTLSYFQRGLCYYLSANYVSAKADLLKFYESTDYKDDCYIYLALSCFNCEDYINAKKFFNLCLSKNTYLGESNYYLGIMLLNEENYSASIPYLTKAIENKTQIDSSTYNRAIAYLKLEDLDNAKKDFLWVKENSTDTTLVDNAAFMITDIERYQKSVIIINNSTTSKN